MNRGDGVTPGTTAFVIQDETEVAGLAGSFAGPQVVSQTTYQSKKTFFDTAEAGSDQRRRGHLFRIVQTRSALAGHGDGRKQPAALAVMVVRVFSSTAAAISSNSVKFWRFVRETM
jgi:hypothetical protein